MVVTIWKDNWGRTKEFLESFNKKKASGSMFNPEAFR